MGDGRTVLWAVAHWSLVSQMKFFPTILPAATLQTLGVIPMICTG